ncbi:MAG TPA: GGDEF domain-containing protein [Solirubrobacteraceae bacterium]|nr:GGDEF domain-containing protein [Solirubrobacteraceae bacterium]
MAATDSYNDSSSGADAGELQARLDEEVSRAERMGTALSCLLVSVDAEALREQQAAELCEQAIAYMAEALRRQLRRFDRVGRLSEAELLVLLPGADGTHAEVVARRALARLRAVKLDTAGGRHPIGVAIGLGSWSAGQSAAQLLDLTRLATGGRREPDITWA